MEAERGPRESGGLLASSTYIAHTRRPVCAQIEDTTYLHYDNLIVSPSLFSQLVIIRLYFRAQFVLFSSINSNLVSIVRFIKIKKLHLLDILNENGTVNCHLTENSKGCK